MWPAHSLVFMLGAALRVSICPRVCLHNRDQNAAKRFWHQPRAAAGLSQGSLLLLGSWRPAGWLQAHALQHEPLIPVQAYGTSTPWYAHIHTSTHPHIHSRTYLLTPSPPLHIQTRAQTHPHPPPNTHANTRKHTQAAAN